MRAEEIPPDVNVLPEDGHLLRLGGWAAIFGWLMGGIGNLVHPQLPLHDDVGMAEAIAGSDAWVPIHLAIVFGMILRATRPPSLASQTLNFSLVSVFNILFAGVTFILFGAAVAVATVYPRWLGWVAVAAGALSIAAGIVQGMIGAPTAASRTMTIIGPSVITTWLLVIGFLQVRRANLIETGVT